MGLRFGVQVWCLELSVNLGFRDSRFGISSSRIGALRVGIRAYREDVGLRI